MTTQASADPQGTARDGARVQPGSGTYEWWYFDGQTDDGTAFQIHFQAPAADYIDPRPSVMIHLKRPDGTIAAGEAFVPMDQYRASTRTCDVTIGENTVTGDLQTYRLHIAAGDLAADLIYHSQTPAWAPKARGWFVAVPYGTFQGTVTYDGKTIEVSGTGYHDHNWGHNDLGAAVSETYWGRAGIGHYTIVFVQHTPRRSIAPKAFLLYHKEELITGAFTTALDEEPFSVVAPSQLYESSRGKGQPGKLDVTWNKGADSVHLTYTNPQRVQETYEYSRRSGAARTAPDAAAKNPSYMSFLADAELTITRSGTTDTFTGNGIYEHRTME
jgi:hypothetical protein